MSLITNLVPSNNNAVARGNVGYSLLACALKQEVNKKRPFCLKTSTPYQNKYESIFDVVRSHQCISHVWVKLI